MNLKLILSGIVLLALLVACADRNNEEAATLQPQKITTDMRRSETSRVVSDTLKTPETQYESNSASGPGRAETIDPTKPDRPK